jgi:DNA-binding XRE family transcriptional regulator|tara:strand:+ start:534 stop:725 length:192 start_codon:yes stop_codon:yes gene_type:complete
MQNEFIRMARFKLGDITQQQLADQLGCTKQTLHFAESGKRSAKPMLLLAIECLLRRADLHPEK